MFENAASEVMASPLHCVEYLLNKIQMDSDNHHNNQQTHITVVLLLKLSQELLDHNVDSECRHANTTKRSRFLAAIHMVLLNLSKQPSIPPGVVYPTLLTVRKLLPRILLAEAQSISTLAVQLCTQQHSSQQHLLFLNE
eukprot:PhF_6_TR41291/c0_g1_i3/m.62485